MRFFYIDCYRFAVRRQFSLYDCPRSAVRCQCFVSSAYSREDVLFDSLTVLSSRNSSLMLQLRSQLRRQAFGRISSASHYFLDSSHLALLLSASLNQSNSLVLRMHWDNVAKSNGIRIADLRFVAGNLAESDVAHMFRCCVDGSKRTALHLWTARRMRLVFKCDDL